MNDGAWNCLVNLTTFFSIDASSPRYRGLETKVQDSNCHQVCILQEFYNQVAPKIQWSYCIYLDLLAELASFVSKGKGGYP